MKHFEKLTDKQLAATAKEIAAEEKRRANLKAAASAILTVLSKHRLSLRDLTVLDLGQKPTARAKKKPRQWTGHSFRVGAAVDLVESGYTIEQVMRKGDWKSVQSGLRYVMAE